MDYRAKHYRYHRRKRGAKIAKMGRVAGMIVLAIGIILVVGAAGASDCQGAFEDVISNSVEGLQYMASGAILEGLSWAVDALTC